MKLYELSKQFQEVQELDPDIIGDTLEAIELEFNDKAKNIGFVYRTMNAQVDVLDKEIKRLQDMKSSINKRKQGLIDYLRNNMQACGIKKIECDLFKIQCVKGRDIVAVDDEHSLPDEFIKTSTSVDKTALLKALKDGPVNGAHLEPSKTSIRIY